MKNYSEYKHASISMSTDAGFIKALDDLFKNNNIQYVIESGTFKGLGSTTTLAKAMLKNNIKIKEFITIEIDKKFHKEAIKNLKQFPFITPVCGLSVNFANAKRFIENDEAINHHEKFPDIFIDSVTNPKQFYLNEIEGKLSSFNQEKKNWWSSIFSNSNIENSAASAYPKENILEYALSSMKDKQPLILLDSAGGIGYLEFSKTMEIMKNHDFYLILDDIHHLKHFRSYRDVTENPKFTILGQDIAHGWILAKYTH